MCLLVDALTPRESITTATGSDGGGRSGHAARPGRAPRPPQRQPSHRRRGAGTGQAVLHGGLTAPHRHLPILTSVTVLTRLLASTKSPSRVTEVLRTMSPPPGIAQLWNFSVLGSKRTTVFGVVPDSLYQITSLIAEIP